LVDAPSVDAGATAGRVGDEADSLERDGRLPAAATEAGGDDGARRAPSIEGRGAASPSSLSLRDLPDAQLVLLGRAGERAALEALYRRHASFAIHLATRIEGSSRDVEDVVHDAFIKAFSRLNDLSEPASFRGWLGSIVVFAVRSRLRRHRLMSVLGLRRGVDPIDLDELASSDASPHVRAQLAQIYALLRTLPTDDRIAWTLRSVEGHELEAVARLTDCSLATVKRRIARAQRFLEEHFISVGAAGEDASPAPPPTDEGHDPRRSSRSR
jgi:RNA polymerase sigma-70 factor (ECF subfamily)